MRDKMAWQGTKVSQVLQVRREKMVRTAPMAIPVRTVLPASLASKAPHRLSKVPLAVLEKKAWPVRQAVLVPKATKVLPASLDR